MKKIVMLCMLVLFLFSSGTVFGDTFSDITIDDIIFVSAELSGDNIYDDQLLPGTILLYQTSVYDNGRYGKLEIATIGDVLNFKFVTYDELDDGTVYVYHHSDLASIDVGTANGFNLEQDVTVRQADLPMPPQGDEFFWKQDTGTGQYYLEPRYGAKFTVYNPVPIPSAFLLFTSSLIGIVGLRKKFRK